MDLITAVKDGNFEGAFSLITSGADLNARDKDRATPLYWSACRGNAPLCEVLVQAGCNVNAHVRWGSTALHAAADRGQFPCVEILVAWGADINAQNNRGDSPLHISAYRGFLDIIKHLVSAGANVLLRNEKNKTPQEEAAAGGHDQAANYLLSVMEGYIKKQQNQMKSTRNQIIAGCDQIDGPTQPPGYDVARPTNSSNLLSNNRQEMFSAATYLRSASPTSSMVRFQESPQNTANIENGAGHDSGVFHQDLHCYLDRVDGVTQLNRACRERITFTPPVTGGKPSVYRRSVSAQESSAALKLHNLQTTGYEQYASSAQTFNNVPQELASEFEDPTNSFDSSYMSSASDTSSGFDTSLYGKCVTTDSFGATMAQGLNAISESRFTLGNQPDRWFANKNSSGTNEVVLGLAEELTECKQENKRLNMDKVVLENKVISQQNVIKEISKENLSLKKGLHEKPQTKIEENDTKMHKPTTSHVELKKLLEKTKTFGMSTEEKENLHKELQAYITENILKSVPNASVPLDKPGKEWSPGIDYVILGDKPINKAISGQKQRSLVFLIKHLKTGRKLVLKIMINLLNLNFQDHGDGFSLSTYLNENFSPGHTVPEQLLEHAGVLKILHHFEGSTDRFKKFVNMLVKQTTDVQFEMANRSLFLVMNYFPQTLEELICDLNLTNSGNNYGSTVTFITIVLYQLLSVLHFIQDKNIAHRNIMCQNIFIDNSLCPKLGGFGFACSLNGIDGKPLVFSSKTEAHAGNDCAWTPELVHYYDIGPIPTRQINLRDLYYKSDVFALGQAFHSILTKSKSECFYVNRLHSSGIKLPSLPVSLPAALCHVIRKMEAENPTQRYSAKQAMQRVGMILFPPTEKDVKCQEDSQSYCNAKLLQILATESCCFKLPETKERLTPEQNVQLLRPRLEAHFLCNTSPSEFWDILQEFKNLNIKLL